VGKLLTGLIFAGMAGAQAQDPPEMKADSAAESSISVSQDDKHILGVVPNYATVNDPNAVFHPLSAKEKFITAAHDTFDPFNWAIAGLYSAVYQWQNDYPQWGQGAQGYAKRYGATFTDGALSSYLSEGVLPTLLHEDPRYFTSTNRSFFGRVFNTVRYVVIDRSDSGRPRLALSNMAGALAGGFVGNAYLPDPYANASRGFRRSAIALTGFVTSNLGDEFHPEIHKVAKKLHLPF